MSRYMWTLTNLNPKTALIQTPILIIFIAIWCALKRNKCLKLFRL